MEKKPNVGKERDNSTCVMISVGDPKVTTEAGERFKGFKGN